MRSLVGSTPTLFRHPIMATETFRGKVPDGLLYDTRHDMWVRREGVFDSSFWFFTSGITFFAPLSIPLMPLLSTFVLRLRTAPNSKRNG